MAVYSFRGSGGDFGSASGLGGWLTGIGPAFGQAMSTGIQFTNALRDMNSQNYLQPYMLSAGANRLTEDRLGSLARAQVNQLALNQIASQQNAESSGVAGVSANLNAPAPAEQQAITAQQLGAQFGADAVAQPMQTDPFFASGMSDTSRMLGLRYPYLYGGY